MSSLTDQTIIKPKSFNLLTNTGPFFFGGGVNAFYKTLGISFWQISFLVHIVLQLYGLV
jgi:hypothetical protein